MAAILYSEQRYFWSIEDRRREPAELVEIIRLPMTNVPKGHCRERIGLRLLAESGSWLMHLKCDTSLAYAISQQPPTPGTHFQMETGRDDRGNRVLLALEPLAWDQRSRKSPKVARADPRPTPSIHQRSQPTRS